ncbi:hypothetical protein DPMN_150810 [Dreissena polymorpha]|uniref:Uncharacterized protein n=1 Tax=Dreissena polymorpha TaxID=45954 RepID=A0A9D4FH65_DREPO|nr:hypothetical protein DPMN_150810 [Dreissena polymorpha]
MDAIPICHYHILLLVIVFSCSTTDEHGDEILGCQLLTSSNSVDPGSFSCDVIDPLDVTPVTKAHEYLISSIIRVSSENIGQVTSVVSEQTANNTNNESNYSTFPVNIVSFVKLRQ